MKYHHTENGWKNFESLNIDISFMYEYHPLNILFFHTQTYTHNHLERKIADQCNFVENRILWIIWGEK